MYDLILKPVAIFCVVVVLLFVFHVFGPGVADAICPAFEESDPNLTARCVSFFDILQ